MVTSLVPMVFVALQMYSPESCRTTLCKTRLLFTTLCLQGRGDPSLDHLIVGKGIPTKTATKKSKTIDKSKIKVNSSIFYKTSNKSAFSHIKSDTKGQDLKSSQTLLKTLPWASQASDTVCPSTAIIKGSDTEAMGVEGTWAPPLTITSTLVSVEPSVFRAVHTYVPLSSLRATRICNITPENIFVSESEAIFNMQKGKYKLEVFSVKIHRELCVFNGC